MILAVAVVGVAAVLARSGVVSLRRVDPKAVIQRAYEQAIDAESLQSSGSMDIRLTLSGIDLPTPPPPVTFTATFSTTRATGDDGLDRGSADIQLSVRKEEQGEVLADASVRTSGAVSYIRLNDLTVNAKEPVFGAIAGGGVGAVKGSVGGKWIAIDPAAIDAFLSTVAPERGAAFPPSPTDEETKAFEALARDAFRANRVIAFDADLGVDRVDGVRAHHYRVHLTRDALVAVFDALRTSPFLVRSPEDGQLMATVRDALAGDVGAQIDAAAVEVWIDTATERFARARLPVVFTFPIPEAPVPPVEPPTSQPAGPATVQVSGAVDVRYTAWGSSQTIDIPTDAVPLQDLLVQFIGGTLPFPPIGNGATVDDAARDVDALTGEPDGDADGLSDARERELGTDPTRSDTDGDGFADGAEVENGYNPNGPGRLGTNSSSSQR